LGDGLDDALSHGESLEAAAKSVGLEAVAVSASDQTGRDGAGAPIPALNGKAGVLADAFKTRMGEDSGLIGAPDGSYHVVRVDSVTPPAQKTLDAVKNDIRTEIEGEKRHAALQKVVDGLIAKGKAGATLDSLAAGLGLAPLKSEPLARGAAGDIFSQASLAEAFSVSKGGFAAGPVGSGESFVLMQVDDVVKPTPEEANAAMSQIKPRLGEIYADEIATIYGDSLEQRYGVKINESVAQSALGGS